MQFDFYCLREQPFGVTPGPRYLYASDVASRKASKGTIRFALSEAAVGLGLNYGKLCQQCKGLLWTLGY
jgi:hypothetical protein